MDNYHLKEFSPDQKLFAIIENDGKLKIYDTERSLLKQEYVPNLHLSTPCTALKWIKLAIGQKRKLQAKDNEGTLFVILGTSKGGLALYSYATGKIESTFKGDGHSSSVTSIDFDDGNTIYTTGLDAQVIKWSVKKCKQEMAFDVGPEKPTAVCSINNGQYIATASKTIKIWNENQELVQTLTGHSSNVLILKAFTHNGDTFILSASKNDRTLSMWKVNEDDKKSICYATFSLLSNSANSVDLNVCDGNLSLACICRNESLSFFHVNLSSIKSKKPVKVKFTLEIAADETKNVTHIPLKCATIDGSNLLIGYGDMLMKFERISTQQEVKNTVLVRKDPMRMEVVKKDKKSLNEALNVVTPIVNQNVEILNTISANKRLQKPSEVPLETRLENLTVNTGKRPTAKKLTYQLIQGLHGNDANILRNVLRQTDEETVRLTVKYLPSQYVMAFVNELSLLMAKKTAGSEVALTWLRHLIQIHSSSLLSFGAINLSETFGTTLGIIDHRTQNLPALMRMRGRLSLLVGQLKQNSDFDEEIHNENVLVYEDSDDESLNNVDGKSESSNEDIYHDFEDEENGSNGKLGDQNGMEYEQSEDEGMDTS